MPFNNFAEYLDVYAGRYKADTGKYGTISIPIRQAPFNISAQIAMVQVVSGRYPGSAFIWKKPKHRQMEVSYFLPMKEDKTIFNWFLINNNNNITYSKNMLAYGEVEVTYYSGVKCEDVRFEQVLIGYM